MSASGAFLPWASSCLPQGAVRLDEVKHHSPYAEDQRSTSLLLSGHAIQGGLNLAPSLRVNAQVGSCAGKAIVDGKVSSHRTFGQGGPRWMAFMPTAARSAWPSRNDASLSELPKIAVG